MGTNIKNRVEQAAERIGHLDLTTPLLLALDYMQDDPSGSLGKSRVVLEKLVLALFIAEMGKAPKKTEVGLLLNNNQFTRHIERRIVSRMNAARDLANLGVHGETVISEDAEEVLVKLCGIIDWYHHSKHTDQPITPSSANDASINQLINEAHSLARNKHYNDALQRWQQVQSLDPSNSAAAENIDALEQREQQRKKITQLRQQLMRHIDAIRPIFHDVVKRLNNLSDSGDDETRLLYIEMFIQQAFSAEDFIESWQSLTEDTAQSKLQSLSINYNALVGRIQRGELILFIGSGIAQEYNAQPLSEHDMAQQLAKDIEQQALQLSFSSIAEYYDLRDEYYGRPKLLRNLHQQLPTAHQSIEFYHSLAQLQPPLLLISTAYDDLLEQAFDQHQKPYVELSSLIHRNDEHDMGSLVLRYSDADSPATPINEEALSELNLLKQNYSIIYKIRGTCRHNSHNGSTITLMESDYFRFARYAERMIPSYIGKQFHTRAFLLLGCQPQQWEDRLILNTLLEKRGGSDKNCLMLGNCRDEFETAYWLKRNVIQHSVSIRDLDHYLQQAQEAS